MPRDKTLSHQKVIESAMSEFMEKGYENASMRSIGEKAGMTPAGLYRHYKNKEDMFNALVEPAIVALGKWYKNHKSLGYRQIDNNASVNELFAETDIDFMREVVYRYSDEFKLILLHSQGTKYENFIHDIVKLEQYDMIEALKYMKSKGMNVNILSELEMHTIMSAYTTAIFEPFVHNMEKKEAEHCLMIIEEFFMPGWRKIMGF